MKKRIFYILMALFILFVGALSVFTCSHFGFDKISAYFSRFVYENEFSEDKPMSTYYFDKLTGKEKSAYITVFNEIRKHPEFIKVPELTNDEFNNVFFAVKNDNPDFLCFADHCNMISFWSASFFQMTYSYDVSECENMTSEMMQIANEMISDISVADEFERELIIHDRMINHCDYEETVNSSNAYGFFVEKKAVCSGYSRAAMILFNKLGINSFVITGIGISAIEGKVNHMWNIVEISGKPYHVDVTWDDPVSDSDNFLSHMYFNLTDESISIDHSDFNSSYTCTEPEYNYFVFNNTLYDEYSDVTVNDIADKLKINIQNGIYYIEFEFSDAEDYNTALGSMVNNSSSSSDMYKILNILGSDTAIDTSHVNFSMDDARRYIRLGFDVAQK